MNKLLVVLCLIFVVGNAVVWHGTRKALTVNHFRKQQQTNKIHRNYKPRFPVQPLTMNYKIGTAKDPNQQKTFVLSIEAGENSIWVLSPEYPALTENNTVYDPNDSTTSTPQGYFYGRSGDFGLTGNGFSDLISDFEFTFNQTFGQVYDTDSREVPWNSPYLAVDGSFGMGWNPKNVPEKPDANSEPILNFLYAQKLWNPSDRFYVVLFHNITETLKDLDRWDWLISFGWVFHECESDFDVIPLSVDLDTNQNDFSFDSFTFGQNYQFNLSGLTVRIDTGMPAIAMPYDTMDQMISGFDWLYDWDYSVFTVNCDDKSKLDDWVFERGDKTYSIPASDYLLDVGMNNNQCVVGFTASDDWFETDWVLGSPFLVGRCIKFDIANSTVGIGRSRN
ncbi:Eukaryotic aspartyl protease [Aphelenchoides besseyi]|nr:Eukaryotic aspartyl protease [Aphelenchoides besseyi]